MKRQRHSLRGVVSLVVVLLVAAPLHGGEIDARAQATLKQVAENLQRARVFVVDISISTTEQHEGSNLTLKTSHELAVSKPDKIAFLTKTGAFGTTVLFQGCNEIYVELPALTFGGVKFSGSDMGVTFISDGTKTYVSAPYMLGMPKSETSGVTDVRDGADLKSFFFLYDIAPYANHGACASLIIQAVFFADPAEGKVLANATELRYLGREAVGGEECHKLKYCFPKDNEWYLFILANDTAILREVRAEYSHKGDGMNLPVRQSTVFRNWKIGQPLPPDQFKLPPQDAKSSETKGG